MEDRLRLIVRKTLGEPCMLNFLLGLRLDIVHFTVRRGQNVVRAQVKRAEHIKRDLAIESKALEPDGRDFLSVLVKSVNRGGRHIATADGGDGMVDLVGLASIGDKDKFKVAQESFQAESRAESMVRAANSLLAVTHSMKLLLLVSDEAQIAHRRDAELRDLQEEAKETKANIAKLLDELFGRS